jgi:signal transduction histidine kinase
MAYPIVGNALLFCTMKRNAAVGVLMIASELALCGFLLSWLLAQWGAEEDNLRKDVKYSFTTVVREVTDSAMRARMISRLAQRGALHSKDERIIIEKGGRIEAEPLSLPAQNSIMIHRSVWSNGRDSFTMEDTQDSIAGHLLTGVQEILTSILPDSVQKSLATKDTGRIGSLFRHNMIEEGMRFPFTWTTLKAIEQRGSFLIHGDGINSMYVVSVTGYKPFLIQKILPQMLFALGLVLITSFAFALAWRSLQRERKLSLMKNSLVSNMSHELKTPVSTVKVALEALGEEDVLNDRQTVREYVGIASSELKRLELLINSTLHTSLLESGKLPMQYEQVDLRILAEHIADSLQLRFQKVQASITMSFAEGDYTVKADRLHVQGVLLNILDNALKYGGEEVKIHLQGSANSQGISLGIADNGPGIPKAYHRRVFEQFFRVPTGNVHEVKGYGLGLNYASEVMRQHGGSITVSTPAGGGALFTLFFTRSHS